MGEKGMNRLTIGSGAVVRRLLLVLMAYLLSGCAMQPPAPPVQLLLMGEVHDNPQGHRQRFADIRKRVVEDGWRPAIVMEQFDRENQRALTQAQASCADAPCVIKAAGGKRWEWPLYESTIALALRYHLPLVAGNVSRTDAAIAMKQGLGAVLTPETMDRFKLHAPLPSDLVEGQRHAIEVGHCGKLPDSMAQGMVRAQVARDVWMAQMLLDNAKSGAVLLAGNGHVRKDLGVPRWIVVAAPVVSKATQVHTYTEPDDVDTAAASDVNHPVAAHPRPDPCLAFATPVATGQPPNPKPKE